MAPSRPRDDDGAAPEPEVERLDDVGLGLEQHVLPHDAEVGHAVFHVGEDVGGLDEQRLGAAVPGDEAQAPLGVLRAAKVEARAGERAERERKQAALGQRGDEARGRPLARARARGAGGGAPVLARADALDDERKAHGRVVAAELADESVVAPARQQGRAKARGRDPRT